MVAIKIKHAGKAYDVDLDPSLPGLVFKQQIHQLTGVDPAKVKVVVKGGMLKDDADVSKLGIKEGQTIMVIGAAGELPPPPAKAIKFMEDMSDADLAQATKFPVGLVNLGNTCYMNSTVQVLRAIPELHTALQAYNSPPASGSATDRMLTTALRDLYGSMSKTSNAFPPMLFIQMLRNHSPQFAEMARGSEPGMGGGGYAQQDAEEAWGAILNAVRHNLDTVQPSQGKFIEKYLMGQMTTTMKCKESSDEPETTSLQDFNELKCNIGMTTNYMIDGIGDALNQEIEKNSPSLGRSAVYEETARISRLPQYLTVHQVRFYWRRDIGKKTKIMRKVKFPFDLDLIDLLTPDLKARVLPLNQKLKEVDKDRRERAKVRRRAKVATEDKARLAIKDEADKKAGIQRDPALAAAGESSSSGAATATATEAMDVDTSSLNAPDRAIKMAGELEDEPTKRKEEIETLTALLDPQVAADVGANGHGMYELVGVVTHKGASADGGHYVGWSRVTEESDSPEKFLEDPDKQMWYRFDDDKVTTVSRDKITALEGGGEDHTAYIMLYRAKSLE